MSPPDAENDIQKAIYYYDSFSAKTGEKFFNSLLSDIQLLKTHALAFQIRYDDIRLIHTKGFPYSIHYSVYMERKLVVIEALINQREDTQKLK